MLITGFRCYQPEPSLLAFPINFLPNTFSSINPLFHYRWQKGDFLTLSNLWHFIMILQRKTFSYQVNLIYNKVRINTSFFQSTILKILSWCTSSLQRWLMHYYDLTNSYRFMSTVFFFFLMFKLFHLWPMEAPYSWLLGPFDITLLLLIPCFQTQDSPTSSWIFPAPFNGTVWVLGYALLLDSDCYQTFSMGKAMQ